MADKRNRIIIAIVGFIIFIIPLFFLRKSIKNEISITQNRIEESLQEKLLSSAISITERLAPHNYLIQEFNNIHASLFPDFPKEIITGTTDDNELKELYNEKLLTKLVTLLKEKYNPIVITVGTQNLNDLHSYYCPILENDLQTNNEEKDFQEAKSYYDMSLIVTKHNLSFFTALEDHKIKYLAKLENFLKQNHLSFKYYLPLCFKYISRYKSYNRNESPFYTDYYEKQTLYPILKSTISSNTIHGYYSILIPQKYVDPEEMLDSVVSKTIQDINISLDDNFKESAIIKNKHGYTYSLKYPTIFINQINAFKRLRNIDKSFLLKKQINISIDFPNIYIKLNILNYLIELLFIISILVFIAFSIKSAQDYQLFKLKLSNKLLIILSLIIFLPITGIGLLSFIITHNLNEIIDSNTSKNLHNSLENYYLLKDEINARQMSSIFEMKRRIAGNTLSDSSETFFNNIISDEKTNLWFKNFTSDLYVITDRDKFYHFDFLWQSKDLNENSIKADSKNDKMNQIMKFIMRKYISNLGLLKKSTDNNTEMFTLSLIENYINIKEEETSVAKESIPNKGPIYFREFDNSIYFYAKDKNNDNYFLLNRLNGNTHYKYNILHKYFETKHMWFKPKYKYAYDTNLTIAIAPDFDTKSNAITQFPSLKHKDNTNEQILKMVSHKDNGYSKFNVGNETIINEWLFSETDPFFIAGTTKSLQHTEFSFTIGLIFPLLFVYATLLLILLNNLISNFLNKPINIYNEALNELASNKLGTTIQSFSNDEYSNITKAFNEMSLALKQKEQIKRYISDRLIQSVESNNIEEISNGKLEKVTILSSDIRNFTGISEKYEPYEIVEMLNSYFTRMQQVITENNGIIDKYIGDAIQAVFYDDPDRENMIIRATRAAINMRKALNEYNKERKSNDLFTIENGIGIATGFAITGTIGITTGRKDFSVNGEVIAKASNLEAKTKMTQSKILLSKKAFEDISNIEVLVTKEFDEEAVELIDVK